jgi:hypothetical protein
MPPYVDVAELSMEADAGGDYVRYADYLALAQQRDAAVRERDNWILRAAHERNGEVRTFRARLAACEGDAARLDWLGRQMDGVHIEAGVGGGEYQMRWFATVYTFDKEFRADTVREAIDKAMNTASATARVV